MPRTLVIRSVLPIALLGAVLAGCSDNEPGTPTAGASTTTSAGKSTATTSTSASGGGSALADFDPCAELTAVAGQLPLTGIEEDGTQECQARYGASIAVRVKAFPNLGIAEYVPGASSRISDLPLGGHQAKLVTAPGTSSSCAVTVGITAKSRVDFVASANASQDEACDAATKVATAVEPKLPK